MGPKEDNNTASKYIGEKFALVANRLNGPELKIKELHGGVPVVKKSPLSPAFRRPLLRKIEIVEQTNSPYGAESHQKSP